MAKSDRDSGQSSSPWRFIGWLDSLDLIVYGGLGGALLCYVLYRLGAAIWDFGYPLAWGVFLALLAGTIGQAARDAARRRFSPASRLLVGAWAACVGIVLLIELTS